MRTRGREGVKNPENFAYVLNGSPLTEMLFKAGPRLYDKYVKHYVFLKADGKQKTTFF